jgi:N12 class adenine-specific DNA methylase
MPSVGPREDRPGLIRRTLSKLGRAIVPKTPEEEVAERSFAAQAELEAREHPGFANLQSDQAKLRFTNVFRRRYGLEALDALPRPAGFGDVMQEEWKTPRGLLEKLPYMESALTAVELVKVHRALGRVTRGEGTMADFETLTQLQERMAKESRGTTWGGMVAKIPSQSVPFMGELATGGAITRAGVKGAEKIAGKLVGKEASAAAVSAMRKMAGKATEKGIVSTLAKAGVETAQRGLPNIAVATTADTLRRTLPGFELRPGDDEVIEGAIKTPGQPFLGALRDSGINATIQVYSEYTGKAVGHLVSKVGKAGAALGRAGAHLPGVRVIGVPAEKAAEWMAATRASIAADLVERFPNKYATMQAAWHHLREVGYNQPFEEIGEERVAELMEAAAKAVIERGGDKSALRNFQAPTGGQLTAEFAGFLIPGAVTLGASALVPESREFPRPAQQPPGPGEADIPDQPNMHFPNATPSQPLGPDFQEKLDQLMATGTNSSQLGPTQQVVTKPSEPFPHEGTQLVVVPRGTSTSASDTEETLSDGNPVEDISQGVGDIGKGIAEGLYVSIFDRLQKGKLPSPGKYQSPEDQAVKAAYDAGQIHSVEDVKRVAQASLFGARPPLIIDEPNVAPEVEKPAQIIPDSIPPDYSKTPEGPKPPAITDTKRVKLDAEELRSGDVIKGLASGEGGPEETVQKVIGNRPDGSATTIETADGKRHSFTYGTQLYVDRYVFPTAAEAEAARLANKKKETPGETIGTKAETGGPAGETISPVGEKERAVRETGGGGPSPAAAPAAEREADLRRGEVPAEADRPAGPIGKPGRADDGGRERGAAPKQPAGDLIIKPIFGGKEEVVRPPSDAQIVAGQKTQSERGKLQALYNKALEQFRTESSRHLAVTAQYRAKRIGDDEFLKSSERLNEAGDLMDRIEQQLQSLSNAEKPAIIEKAESIKQKAETDERQTGAAEDRPGSQGATGPDGTRSDPGGPGRQRGILEGDGGRGDVAPVGLGPAAEGERPPGAADRAGDAGGPGVRDRGQRVHPRAPAGERGGVDDGGNIRTGTAGDGRAEANRQRNQNPEKRTGEPAASAGSSEREGGQPAANTGDMDPLDTRREADRRAGGRSAAGAVNEQQVPSVLRGAGEAGAEAPAEQPPTTPASIDHSIDKAGVTDYVISDPANLFAAGKNPSKTIFRRNVDAIRLAKKLKEEGRERAATQEERAILSRYQGWGSVPEPFDGRNRYSNDKGWQKEFAELDELLTSEEWKAASSSTKNAMYTPPAIVTGVWEALHKMGFRGGKVLEPSGGVGHWFGLQPVHLANNSQRALIEKDNITAAIAKALYPASMVEHTPFEEAALPKNYFDLAVSNVPFGDLFIHDKRYPKWLRQFIHDYFFVRSLDLVRPGGLVAFITTKGTMDKLDARFRVYIAERADLVGAVRLNEDSLPGTKVTTDIIFLKKRGKDEPAGGEAWVNSRPYEPLPGKVINEYFQNRPEMVLGEIKAGSLYSAGEEGPTETIVEAPPNFDLAKDLNAALAHLPADIFGKRAEALTRIDDVMDMVPSPKNLPPGAFFTSEDGTLRQAGRRGDAATNVESIIRAEEGETAIKRLKAMVDLRTTMQELLRASIDPKGDTRLPELQKELNRKYDAMARAKLTPLHSNQNTTLLESDVFTLSLLTQLEKYDPKTRKAEKSEYFTRRMLDAYQRPTAAETTGDALNISLDESAQIDLERIGELLGIDAAAARVRLINEGLAFPLPGDEIVATADYLSGNVREKLKEAEALAKADAKQYARNVEALKAAQPADLPASRIRTAIGAPWIPAKLLEEFLASMIGNRRSISIRRSSATGRWTVAASGAGGTAASQETWGTPDYNTAELLDDELNMKTPKVLRRNADGSRYLDTPASDAAKSKLEEIKAHFETWVWAHPKWGPQLLREYNDTFNSWVPKKYDGSHLSLPGSNPAIKLRGYQKDGVSRVLSSPYNTLIYTAVGGGKTYTATAAAMEAIRLGLARKVAIVVDRATLNQFIKSARTLYPGAQFVAISTNDLSGMMRAKTLAKVAIAEKTVFVIPHQQFTMLPVSEATLTEFYGEMIKDMEDAIAEADASKASQRSVKKMEAARDNLLARLKEKVEQTKKTASLPFEELGIDWIMYDEAHKVKNLQFATQIENVRGLGNPAGNQITLDLYMKARFVSRLQNGRGLTFFTGTPVNNSISEIYTMQRYLQPDVLKAQGIASFDDWVRMFAVAAPKLENVAQEYKMVTRLRKFMNLSGLYGLWDKITHVAPHEEVVRVVQEAGGDIPVVAENSEGKRSYEVVALEVTPGQKAYQKVIRQRREAIKARGGKPPQPGDDIILSVITDEKKASLDMRLLYPNNPEEPGNKLTSAANNIVRIHKETAADRLTQLVFINQGAPGKKTMFSTYDAMIKKLVDGGVDRDEIATIYDAKNDAQKAALFDRVNAGEIRILLGSMKKMGQGVNVQERVIASHELEAAWEPGTLEQVRGRSIRSGNRNKEVKLYRYVAKGMADEFMYSLLAAKHKTNTEFLSGKLDADEIEDVDTETLAFEMAMAAGSENKAVLEWTTLSHNLNRLQGESRYHRDAQMKLRNQQVHTKAEIKRVSELIPKAKKFQEWAATLPPASPFLMDIGNTTYEKHTDAGKALFDITKRMNDTDKRKVGQYRGLAVNLQYMVSWGDRNLKALVSVVLPPDKGDLQKFLDQAGIRLGNWLAWDAAANPTEGAMRHWITTFAHELDDIAPESFTRRLAALKEELTEIDKTVDKPFGKQKEMDEIAGRVRVLADLIAKEAEKNANQAQGHAAQDDGKEEDEDGNEPGTAGGGASDLPGFPPTKESLLPDHLTPEQRGWMREHWHEPLFGMGATQAAIPDPTGIMERAQAEYGRQWDRIVGRLKNMKTVEGQRRSDFFGRGLYDAEWKLAAPERDLFQWARGMKRYHTEVARNLNERLNRHVAAVRKKHEGKPWPKSAWRLMDSVIDGETRAETLPADMRKVYEEEIKPFQRQDRRQDLGKRLMDLQKETVGTWDADEAFDVAALTEHQAIEDVLRGKSDYYSLTPAMQAWFDNYKEVMDTLTDHLLNRPHLLVQAKAGGLVNFEEIVKLRQSKGGAYVRRLYHMMQQPKLIRSVENRLAGPRIKMGMFKFKRSDEELWSVRLANGDIWQTPDSDAAFERMEREREAGREKYGQSILQKVIVMAPIGADTVEHLGPVRDLRVLLTRSIVDMATNLSHMELFHQLATTVGLSQEEYLELPEEDRFHYVRVKDSEALGELANLYVPEAVWYNLMQEEQVMTGVLSQVWDIFLNIFKAATVLYSAKTWMNNLLGQNAIWIYLGLNPLTHRSTFVDAAKRIKEGINNPTIARLMKSNELTGGWDRDDVSKYLAFLSNPKNTISGAVAQLYAGLKRLNRALSAGYSFIDDVTKVASYIRDTEMRGLPHAWAIEQLRYTQNYDRLGKWAKKLRKSPIGDPFIAFPDQMVKITIKAAREHPMRVMALYAVPGILNFASKIMLGVTDEEMTILDTDRQRSPKGPLGFVQGSIDRYFQPIMPWRGSDGLLRTWDMRWIMPLASDFRTATGPGGVGVPFLFSQPFVKPSLEVMFNRSLWTGQDVIDDSSAASSAWSAAKYVAWESAPVPTIARKGVLRIFRAATGESGEEFIPVLLKEVFGIRITRSYANKSAAYDAVHESLGERNGRRAVKLIEFYNRYKSDREKPITESTVEQSAISRATAKAKRERIAP